MAQFSRRSFLRKSAQLGAGSLGLARLHRALATPLPHPATSLEFDGGYGPLVPAKDQATGLRLLKLPRGFRYLSMSWSREPMADGRPIPPLHDGTAAFAGEDGMVRLVRNHEVEFTNGTFADGLPSWDPRAAGGTTTVTFDPVAERHVETRASLVGTLRNCAGGPTPWGSWLSCEETLAPKGALGGLERDHGYVFEVPVDGVSPARPLRAMGRLFHEAAAVDPESGIVYHSEDRKTAGFYRTVPVRPGELVEGGTLEMLAVTDRPRADLRKGQEAGVRYPVSWVPIADPERPHSLERPGDCLGVFTQGWNAGGAMLARLEGLWWHQGKVFFTATNGGDRGCGQIWSYSPSEEILELVYESPSHRVMTGPDNLTVSPRGGLVVCEDGAGRPLRVNQLTSRGVVHPLVENRVRIDDGKHPWQGDFRYKEFTGACFSPDGKWLFVNVQTPGVTFAITGPWERGEL